MRFVIFGVSTTVLELMIYALFIIWLFSRFIQNTEYLPRRQTGEIQAAKPLFVPIILILVGVTLATIFSSDLRTSAGAWKAWFVDPILLFIILVSVIKNTEQVKRVLFSLFLSGTAVSIIALVYLILGKLDPVGRLQAFYTSPNYLAMYLAPALIIIVGYYLFTFLASPGEARSGMSPSFPRGCGDHARFGLIARKNIISNIFILLAVIFLELSIFLTHSYGAWFGIIAAIGFVSSRLTSRRLGLLIFGLTLVIILILGYFALTLRQPSLDAG